MEAYDIVKKARSTKRVSTTDVIYALTTDFIECHGDRAMEDDSAVIGGVGLTHNKPITIIGIEKGKTTKENIRRNFGSSGPAGYRKAQRLMKQAEKFNRPILTLINTAGAYAAPDSEKNGIGETIANSLITMSDLSVPTISIILGEGGSGGAIALALTDKVWMMEHSVYSILSPEGFASILWKDANKAPEAAEVMKLTSYDLKEMDVIDRIISEVDKEGKELGNEKILEQLIREIIQEFDYLSSLNKNERVMQRKEKFRKF